MERARQSSEPFGLMAFIRSPRSGWRRWQIFHVMLLRTPQRRRSLIRVISSTYQRCSMRASNPQPSTLNPQPSTLNTQPSTLNTQHSTLNTTLYTLHPEPYTLHPQP